MRRAGNAGRVGLLVLGFAIALCPAAIPVPISPVAGGVLGLLLAALGARASSRRTV